MWKSVRDQRVFNCAPTKLALIRCGWITRKWESVCGRTPPHFGVCVSYSMPYEDRYWWWSVELILLSQTRPLLLSFFFNFASLLFFSHLHMSSWHTEKCFYVSNKRPEISLDLGVLRSLIFKSDLFLSISVVNWFSGGLMRKKQAKLEGIISSNYYDSDYPENDPVMLIIVITRNEILFVLS